MKYTFPAILKEDKIDIGVINVSFPDLMGVYTFAEGRKNAIIAAKSILEDTLRDFPGLRNIKPTSLEQVKEVFKDCIMVEVNI